MGNNTVQQSRSPLNESILVEICGRSVGGSTLQQHLPLSPRVHGVDRVKFSIMAPAHDGELALLAPESRLSPMPPEFLPLVYTLAPRGLLRADPNWRGHGSIIRPRALGLPSPPHAVPGRGAAGQGRGTGLLAQDSPHRR